MVGFQQITERLCSETVLVSSKWKMMYCQGSDGVDVWDCLLARFILRAVTPEALSSAWQLADNTSAAWQGWEHQRVQSHVTFWRQNQLWKGKASPVPMLYQLPYIFLTFPHLLIWFSSLGMPSSHISICQNSIHLELSLFSPMKRHWALTYWASPIHSDT